MNFHPCAWSLLLAVAGMALSPAASVAAVHEADPNWPMLAHDPARSGATLAPIRPPFARKWYRLFPDEGLMSGVQPIVAEGRVFVGTLAGVLHAIDEASGNDQWTFRAKGPILHTSAAGEGKVFFGCGDGKVYALHASNGHLAWTYSTGVAVWNAPLVHGGAVVIGARDGRLLALEADRGAVRWATALDAPLLASPALDAKAGIVYAASEDMTVHAVDFRDGRRLWRSPKLPGATFRGYHPVVAPDGSVLVTVAPVLSQDSISPMLADMVKEIFGDMASWRHSKAENARLREENFRRLSQPGTYEAQLAYLRQRLGENPACQTFFVLDPKTGRPRPPVPIVYAESMNGTGSPAVVTPDGRVIVKYQALLRSRYEHYSPLLNVGYLDAATGHITPIMDQSRTYGWYDSLLLVHDEQSQLMVAGRMLVNTHQDNVNALDLDTREGYREPLAVNLHEPRPGEALTIWKRILESRPIPEGNEWLARATAVYGGGSAIDVPISVAGDSFYYLPTHELNAGAAVIAYRMQAGNATAKTPPLPIERLTDEEKKQIASLAWDWDTLDTPRLKKTLDGLPQPRGTRREGLRGRSRAGRGPDRRRGIGRRDLANAPARPRPRQHVRARRELAAKVQELIASTWRPLVFPAAKHPIEGYRFFIEPTETLEILAAAYPHLEAEVQKRVRARVTAMSAPGGPLDGPTGQQTFASDVGEIRSAYDVPPERLWRVRDDLVRSPVARLYPIWLWCHVSADWTKVETHWKSLADLVDRPPNALEEDCRNGHVAGLIAYCRMARRMQDEKSLARGLAAARQAMRERIAFELTYPTGAVMSEVPVGRTIFSRWRNLTPEVARLCRTYAPQSQAELVERYVDRHRPAWWLAWNVELAWRNESPFSLPTMAREIFDAKAILLREPAEKLATHLDIPWCKADLFYLMKLVRYLESPASEPTPNAPLSAR